MEDDSCKVICGTIGAMGTGITLTAATYVIFIDLPYTNAAYEQAVDRAHRIGTKENVTIINLICRDSVDEKLYKIVNDKKKLSTVMVDGVNLSNITIQKIIDEIFDQIVILWYNDCRLLVEEKNKDRR